MISSSLAMSQKILCKKHLIRCALQGTSQLNSNKADTSTVNNLALQVATKAYKNGEDQIRIRRDTPLTSTAYNSAPFVVELPNGSISAPGIGFHNPNKEGAFFYLQDGKFRYMTSGGGIYEFTTERIGDATTG